jgi:hypothetical protein
MKTIFFIFCLVLSFLGNAQLNKGKYAGNDGATKNLEFYDDNGNLIPIGFHPNIDGSPMLFLKPGIGTITFQNNAKLTDTSLNYSLVDDKLYFIRSGKYYSFKQPVKEFTLQFPEDSLKITIYHFKSGFPKTDKLESTALYELLYEGKEFQLLKWQHKKVEEHSNYGSASEKEFVTDIVYYLYLPSKNKMEKLGMKISQNDLKKLMPKAAQKIDAYLSLHKINFKKEADLLPLFQFIESD